jgi:AraC family transcriptional regulator
MRSDYIRRINRVLDHIESHLSEELTLDDLAGIAHFSPFHFHRIFTAFMNETPGRFLSRVRLGKAARRLLELPDEPVTRIALDCGFSSPAAFAHAFKQAYGMTARQWRAGSGQNRKLDQADRKHPQTAGKFAKEIDVKPVYSSGVTFTQRWRMTMQYQGELTADVEIREMEATPVGYIRHVGPYQENAALFERLIGKLMAWAGPRDLLGPDTKLMTVYHDDPNLVEEDKLRISVCINVPAETEPEGEVGRMELAGGRYAVGRFQCDDTQFGQAWGAMYGGWLPESGYLPDDRHAFELYLTPPDHHPEGKHDFEIWLPVRPA